MLCVAALTACGGGGTAPSASPVPSSQSPTASATPASPSATATPSQTPASPSPTSATATPTGGASSCASFGGTAEVVNSTPGNLSMLTGREIRVGQHPCFERFVLELQGTGGEPFWRVGYRDPLIADPSGEPVHLRGGADLEVVIGVWTVSPYEGIPADQLPFVGTRDIVTDGYTALQQAVVISSFEGMTQIGLGIDTKRNFKAYFLAGPPRLVVDVSAP